MKRFILFALMALTLIAGSLPMSAMAAERASSGAERHSLSHCHEDWEWGIVTCYTLEAVVTATITPAGNAIYTGSSRGTATVTDLDGNVLSESSTMNQFHSLEKDELLHVLGHQARATITLADGTTCTSSYRFHMVDGEIQFEHAEFECN